MRYIILPTLSVAFAILAAPASAQPICCVGQHYHNFNDTLHRNMAWPQPFVQIDRAAARAPFGVMVHNGWRLQNMVGSHHYKPNSTAINEAGQRQIRWVLTQTPPNRRTIYVEQGFTPDETVERTEAVRQFAQRFAIGQEQPDVQVSHLVSRGWPASYADAINVKFSESTPDPRLPMVSEGFEPQ